MSGETKTSLSELQRAAVCDTHPRVLVSAGAGSGKTRLLVEYFIHALLEEKIPADRLVAVTFTRKAAAELMSRIRSTLEERGRPDLARNLDMAIVGTIHSLCRRLLKERSLEAEVDPAFGILEAEAAVLVKEEVRNLTWIKAVEEADEDQLAVLAHHSDVLRSEIIPLYEKLRGVGHEVPQLAVPCGLPLDQARSHLAEATRTALVAGGLLERRSATLERELAQLARCLAWVEGSDGSPDRGDDFHLSERFFPSRKTPSMEACFEPVRQALTAYRHCLAEVRLRPVVAAMNDLLLCFHNAYVSYKRERSLLDFADLELRARTLLLGRGSDSEWAHSRIALSGAFSGPRLMVDEFQDTNELQCSILEGLGASQILMVGDERQSIYRFRGADVEVFRRREAALEAVGGDESGNGLHRLNVNYRSVPGILAFVNRLFAHDRFFGDRFVALTHGRGESAAEGQSASSTRAAVIATEPVAVEILAVERKDKSESDARSPLMQEAEAEVIAARVRRLLDEERWEPRQMAVLLPTQTYVELYQRALLAQGVDVYVVGGKGYYSQEEVADIMSLLGLLLNPHNDLKLLTVLRSPLAGLSDDGLYLLGREVRKAKARSLWEIVRRGKASGLSEFDRDLLLGLVERLSKLRRRVGRPGLARLIDDAVSECGYDLCLLGATAGKRRFANVRKLMRLADDFEALQGPDLAGFVDAIESMGELTNNEGSAPTLAEGENVVRVMTVHQAKGLEFPVVILAGLGSDVPNGSRSQFIVGADGRVAIFLKGSQRKTYESCDLSWGPGAEIVAQERAKELEEDIRLMYVAMTRAQDRLLLVGAKPHSDKLDGCRIGRIALGLGLSALPESGQSWRITGLDATVTGVDAPSSGIDCPDQANSEAEQLSAVAGEDPYLHLLERQTPSINPRHVSFSALAAYRRCPRQFYLERVLGLHMDEDGMSATQVMAEGGAEQGALEDEDVERDLAREIILDEEEARAGREVGLLVHALLQRCALHEKEPASEVLWSMITDALSPMGSHLPQSDLERAVSLSRAFWRSPYAGNAALVEADREILFMFARDVVLVSGIMDLTWHADGLRRIVDYKTNALRGRTPVDVASGYELQATVYALAGFGAGARAVQMDFLFLECPEMPVRLWFDSDDRHDLEALLDQALDDLRRGEFPARSGRECALCSVAELCARMALSSGHGIQ